MCPHERGAHGATRPTLRGYSPESALLFVITEDRLECVEVMALSEFLKRLARLAMTQVAFQNPFQHRLELLEGNSLEHLPPDGLIPAEAATDEDVITFDCFAGYFDFRAEQTDVTHVMLRAGVRAAAQVNVDRLVKLDAFFEIVGQFKRVAFGVRGRELAIGIASAGDQSASHVRLLPVQSHFHERLFDSFDKRVGELRNDEILPDGEPDFTGAVVVSEVSQSQHLLGCDLTDRNGDADIIQAFLLLRINADVAMWDGGRLMVDG